MNDIERVERLITKGNAVVKTDYPGDPELSEVDSAPFAAWQSQCLNFLQSRLPRDPWYIRVFQARVANAYLCDVQAGLAILESVKEDLGNGVIPTERGSGNPIDLIRVICDRFHRVARQLRARHEHRNTLDVEDEYDMQDLFHALLHVYFDDIRPEEWTPSYAGGSARMDFLLKQEQVVIELKKTRPNLKVKQLGDQLIEDIARYKAHPDCVKLLCFAYDPEGLIPNPRGIENDLAETTDELHVEVIIRPNA